MNLNEQPSGLDIGDYGGYSPLPISAGGGLDSNFVAQINPENVVENLQHALSGNVWDYSNKEWVKGKLKPFLNDEGVSTIITRVRSVVNQNTTMSNLDETTIKKMIISLGDELAIILFLNYQKWEVDKANLTTIVSMIQNMAFCALMRAWGEGERDLFKDTVRSGEQFNFRQSGDEQRGMFGKAKSLFGNMFSK